MKQLLLLFTLLFSMHSFAVTLTNKKTKETITSNCKKDSCVITYQDYLGNKHEKQVFNYFLQHHYKGDTYPGQMTVVGAMFPFMVAYYYGSAWGFATAILLPVTIPLGIAADVVMLPVNLVYTIDLLFKNARNGKKLLRSNKIKIISNRRFKKIKKHLGLEQFDLDNA